jgi:predicted metalloprotease with PDZ domain
VRNFRQKSLKQVVNNLFYTELLNQRIMKYIATFFLSAIFCSGITAQVNYSIEYKDSLSSRVKIFIQPVQKIKSSAVFIMPRSVPGAYSMLTYDKFIEEISAISSTGEKLVMRKDRSDAPRWTCTDTGKIISQIVYEVDLRKMESRLSSADASIIRPGFAGLLNYSIFGWIEGTEDQPVHCSVRCINQWQIFSTNEPTQQMATGTFNFNTENYFTLADGQLFMGTQLRVKEFKGLVPLFIVSYCQTSDEYLDDYGKQGMMSLEILNEYFGELPFKQYSILLRKALPLETLTAPALGMEHLQSSTFMGDTSGFRSKPMDKEELIRTMPTYLHHMGHAFMPLRCYGDAYRPYVKEIPPIINNIWFNEGFMWFIPYETLKSETWAKIFYTNTYKADPQIKKMSLQELSQEASLMYGEDFRLGRAVYSRGASMAIEMNKYLKEKTGGKKSMRDVIRFLYYWSKENKRPFTIAEFPLLINKACGVDLTAIYNKWQLPIE